MQLKFIKGLLLITALTLTVAVSGYLNPEVAQAQGPITLNIVNPTTASPADAGSITSPSSITVSVTLSPTAVLTANNFTVTVGSLTATLVSATPVSDTYNLLVTPPTQTVSGTYDLAVSVVSGTLTGTNTVTNAVVYTATVTPPPATPTLMVDILSPTSAAPADAGLITSPTNITVSLMVSPTAVLTADNFAVTVGSLTATLVSATPVSDSYNLVITPPMQIVSGTYDLAVSVVSGTLTGTDTVTSAVAYVGQATPPAAVLDIALLSPTAAAPANAGLINSPTNITVTLAVTASNILTPDNFVVKVGGLTATLVNAIPVSNTIEVIVTPPTQTVTGTFDLMVMVSSGALSDTATEANAVAYAAEPPPAAVLDIALLSPTAAAPADAGLINSPTNITVTLTVTASNILTPDNFVVKVGGITATLVNVLPVSDTFQVIVTPPTQTVTGTFDLMVMVSSGALSDTATEANAVSYAAEPPPAEMLEIDILGPTAAAPADAGLIGSPTNITVTLTVTADETAIPINFMVKVGDLTATVASMNEVSQTYILVVTPPTQTITGTFDLMVMAMKGVMTATDTEANAVSYSDEPPAEELVVDIVSPTTADPADAGLIDSPTNITVTLAISGGESLVADDFAVTIGGLTATVVSVNEVSETYVLLVTPPTQTVSSTFELMVMVTSGEMSGSDTEADAVAYAEEPPADELTINIVSPTTANVANAGIYSSPTNITVTVTVSGATGLTAADVTVTVGTMTTTVVSVNEVSDTYVLVVTPPAQTAAGTFDLMVTVASETSTASDTETNAVSYEDEEVVVDAPTVVTLPNGYRITFLGFVINGDGTSTWNYRVEELPTAQDLSNWVLELPFSCASLADAYPEPWEPVTPDPNANLNGIKWQTGAGFEDAEFYVTVSGEVSVGAVNVAAKGPDVELGQIAGPICGTMSEFLYIIKPTTESPAFAGSATTPNKISVIVNKIEAGLTMDVFSVTIGGLAADIVTVFEGSDRYILDIVPPVQPANGLYDLVVSVSLTEESAEATETEAVFYSDQCNVDVSLILDRSGSMREFGYLGPAQTAANQFVDFMSTGDQVGVGSFATDAGEDYPLTTVSPATKLEAKGTIDSLTAFGFTSIGGGLQIGEQQLDSSTVMTHPSAIVLLSDGKENRPPFVASVLPRVKNKGYPVHTIALGPESDQAMLADIATRTGGTYSYAPTEQTLAGIYNNLANSVACQEQQQPIQSETGVIEEDEEIEYVVDVDGSLTVVDFSIFWTNPGSDIEFVIVAPDGTIIDPSIALTNDDIEFIIGPTYAYYRVRGAVLVPGRWTLRLVGRTLVVPTESFFTDVIGQIRGVAVTMRFKLARTFYLVRSPIKVVVVLADSRPIIGARVTTVIGPILSGRDEDDDDDRRQMPNPILQLFDDGQHGDGEANDGIYANTLAEHNTAAPGGYTFRTFAAGTDNQGQQFSRQTQQLVTVSADGSSPATTINIQAEDGHQENIFLPLIVK